MVLGASNHENDSFNIYPFNWSCFVGLMHSFQTVFQLQLNQVQILSKLKYGLDSFLFDLTNTYNWVFMMGIVLAYFYVPILLWRILSGHHLRLFYSISLRQYARKWLLQKQACRFYPLLHFWILLLPFDSNLLRSWVSFTMPFFNDALSLVQKKSFILS